MKKAISLLASAIIVGGSTQIYAEEEKKETKESLEKKLEVNQDEQEKITKEIEALDLDIQEIQKKIEDTNNQIVSLDSEIESLTRKSEDLKIEIEKNEELLGERIKVMESNSSLGYLEVILSSESISDLFDNIYMVKQVVEQDRELLKTLNDNKSELENNKKTVESKKKEVESLRVSLENNNKTLNDNKAKLEELKLKLEQEENELEKEIEELAKQVVLSDEQIGVISSGSWPVPGISRISSPYGYRIHPIFGVQKMHTGIDIPAPTGTPAVAIDDGVVIFAGVQRGYGNTLMIQHDDGKVSLYAHNSSLVVSKGDRVQKGQVVTRIGSTGNSTGPHLHFEIRINGKHTNPMPYIK